MFFIFVQVMSDYLLGSAGARLYVGTLAGVYACARMMAGL